MQTKMKVFQIVKEHLLKQNCKSISDTGQCRYRGPNGTKCAVGCLIPDAVYNSEMEGVMANHPDVRLAIPDVYHKELLLLLQSIHDLTPVEHWVEALNSVERKIVQQAI